MDFHFRNRRDREYSVLKAIENGGTTLFDLVSTIYKEVDRGLWFVAASNVKLHVEHLAQQHKLPEVMPMVIHCSFVLSLQVIICIKREYFIYLYI